MPFEKLKFKQELKKKHSLSKIIEKKKKTSLPYLHPYIEKVFTNDHDIVNLVHD